VDVTQPLIFSADETDHIGNDYGMATGTATVNHVAEVSAPEELGLFVAGVVTWVGSDGAVLAWIVTTARSSAVRKTAMATEFST
jgi:hypothetical protein